MLWIPRDEGSCHKCHTTLPHPCHTENINSPVCPSQGSCALTWVLLSDTKWFEKTNKAGSGLVLTLAGGYNLHSPLGSSSSLWPSCSLSNVAQHRHFPYNWIDTECLIEPDDEKQGFLTGHLATWKEKQEAFCKAQQGIIAYLGIRNITA